MRSLTMETAKQIALIKMPHKMVCGKLDVGFISGCKSNQTSADTYDSNGRACGALTHYLLKTMDSVPADTPVKKLAALTSKALANAGYSQRPQSEGRRRNKPFLS